MNAQARLRRYERIADALQGLEMIDLSVDARGDRKLKAQVRARLRREYEQLRQEDAEEEAAVNAAGAARVAAGST